MSESKIMSPNGEEIIQGNVVHETARKMMFHCNGLTISQIEQAAKKTVDYFKGMYPIKFPLDRPKE